MIAVIDYGAGNLRSVMHALNHLRVDGLRLARTPDDLIGADKIILPGVGAFGAGMQQLHQQGLVEPLREAVAAGVPYLGICLGMQFLFDASDEMGNHAGLGILRGKVTRFPETLPLKVPHMGWNQLHVREAARLFERVQKEAYFYFVHSYYCLPDAESDVAATADYGMPFCVAVQRDNIYGVQFHPEKSQRAGLQLLRYFVDMA